MSSVCSSAPGSGPSSPNSSHSAIAENGFTGSVPNIHAEVGAAGGTRVCGACAVSAQHAHVCAVSMLRVHTCIKVCAIGVLMVHMYGQVWAVSMFRVHMCIQVCAVCTGCTCVYRCVLCVQGAHTCSGVCCVYAQVAHVSIYVARVCVQ